jgi:hypothetical protein
MTTPGVKGGQLPMIEQGVCVWLCFGSGRHEVGARARGRLLGVGWAWNGMVWYGMTTLHAIALRPLGGPLLSVMLTLQLQAAQLALTVRVLEGSQWLGL